MNYWQPIPISNFQEISSCLKVPDELRQASTYKLLVRNMVVKQLITTLFFIQTTSVTRTINKDFRYICYAAMMIKLVNKPQFNKIFLNDNQHLATSAKMQ
jgi:hypothetical protein